MPPTRWPVTQPGEMGGRITPPIQRFVATPFRAPADATDAAHPLVLNTGRLRDQWHTMTRTGPVPRLMAHSPEPLLHAHPDDAPAPDGALVRVASPWGQAVLRLRHDIAQQPGQVFAPMHWTDVWAAGARINATVNPHVDPVSGQPELKHTPVALSPFVADWHGFVLSRAGGQLRRVLAGARAAGRRRLAA